MDLRTQLINDFVLAGGKDVDILTRILNNFEVSDRITDIACVDDKRTAYLKRYIATKRVEGKSEKTLER